MILDDKGLQRVDTWCHFNDNNHLLVVITQDDTGHCCLSNSPLPGLSNWLVIAWTFHKSAQVIVSSFHSSWECDRAIISQLSKVLFHNSLTLTGNTEIPKKRSTIPDPTPRACPIPKENFLEGWCWVRWVGGENSSGGDEHQLFCKWRRMCQFCLNFV